MKKIPGAMSAARFLSILAIGASLTMAQQPAGTLRGWGSNGDGELADGLTGDSPVPQSVQNLTDVIAVASGGGFTLAVKSDGSVWAWGTNGLSQLGNPNVPTATPLPVPVTGLGIGSGVIAVAAGEGHSMALKADGSVWAWGTNGNGELGNGGPTGVPTTNIVPTQVIGLGSGSGVIAIAAGLAHSMALKSDGSVLTWGLRGSSTPVVVSGLGSGSGVIAIAAGGEHDLALKADGSVAAWGGNTEGQLGTGTPSTGSATPVGVSGLGSGAGIIAIAAGFQHSLALKSDGSVLAWGTTRKAN
jgi:alpha-tubulin suppressor-like RCC1 family protein